MRSKVVRTLALAFLLFGVGIVLGQQQLPEYPGAKGAKAVPPPGKQGDAPPPLRSKQKVTPEKSKLEEMLSEALKNNPDIRVAAAKLAEAEAKLNRTRIQVTQKVVTLHQAISSQKAMIDSAQKKYDLVKRRFESATVDYQVVEQASADLTIAKAKLEELEAQMPALLGKSTHSEANAESVRTSVLLALKSVAQDTSVLEDYYRATGVKNTHRATGPMAERLRKALQTPVKVNFNEVTFDEILTRLSKMVEGLSFRNLFERRGGGHFELPKRSLQFEEAMPVSAILQALEDEMECRFFVREYGIVATSINGAPRGAMTVEEFLRHKPADESRPQSSSGRNPPPENVEGLVKTTDSSGLMTLTIGSDAGLTKGHTLELFRLNPSAPSQSKYLGTVRILEAEAHQSVAQPVSRMSSPPQRGDRVASRLGN